MVQAKIAKNKPIQIRIFPARLLPIVKIFTPFI